MVSGQCCGSSSWPCSSKSSLTSARASCTTRPRVSAPAALPWRGRSTTGRRSATTPRIPARLRPRHHRSHAPTCLRIRVTRLTSCTAARASTCQQHPHQRCQESCRVGRKRCRRPAVSGQTVDDRRARFDKIWKESVRRKPEEDSDQWSSKPPTRLAGLSVESIHGRPPQPQSRSGTEDKWSSGYQVRRIGGIWSRQPWNSSGLSMTMRMAARPSRCLQRIPPHPFDC